MEENYSDDIILYQSEDGKVKLDVRLQQDNIWLSQDQIATLYGKDRTTISKHLRNIFDENELEKSVVCANYSHTTPHGAILNKTQTKNVKLYNLDVIIAVGYRVRSSQGTAFRRWATERLHEYIVKGFTMDDVRLKNNGGGTYWKELLDRIRDIRSSEKVLYRQVLDIYATSADYNPKSQESVKFFQIVQNKIHFAVHGHTAAELIYLRADSEKPFMGLTSFEGNLPSIKDIKVAKNYLSKEELKVMNNLVSGYFDFAEIQAMRHTPVYMKDYIKQLDNILSATGTDILDNAGTVSHNQAMEKALAEYRKYQRRTLSPIEEEYLDTLIDYQRKLNK
ncbi:MAG: virulence RhuM family protein [Bacteroidales bacterium]|nr:virulence RhuM family protein [Bacteroidales bacterium]